MILNDYKLKDSLMTPLENYERDHNVSPIILIESLLEKFLYDNNYIIVEEEKVEKTPKDIYNERKDKFKITKSGEGYVSLRYDTVRFGDFKTDEVETIIKKLLDFSDEELEELDIRNWEYPMKSYKKFIREKVDNASLTPEEYFKKNKNKKTTIEKESSNGVRMVRMPRRNKISLTFKKDIIAEFNMKNYDYHIVTQVYSFLSGLDEKELSNLINKRKKMRNVMVSSEFVVEYMEEYFSKHRKAYVYPSYNGKFLIKRNNYVYGTHSRDMLDEVYAFLESKDWNTFYTTTMQGLKGKHFNEWLYGMIRDETGLMTDGVANGLS